MDKDSKFTRDEDGYVAVRTVSAPYSSGSDDKDSMFTRDEDGYVAVRVTGGGSGGDQHNLGYYATESALTTAHPTAEAGDWAIVGATDTVWVWDTDNEEWVDSDQKGQVTSVNNQTGAVTITADDILPSQTGNAGKFLVTDGTDASWGNTIGSSIRITKLNYQNKYASWFCDTDYLSGSAVCMLPYSSDGQRVQLGKSNYYFSNIFTQKIQNPGGGAITVPAVGGTLALQIATLPTAGSTYEGTIYQFTGATDSTYTNGRFYKCVSDGGNPATYSWEEVSMGGGSSLPSQTGNSGKFLTTDGTDASWATINALQNVATENTSVAVTPNTSVTNYKKATTLGVYAASGEDTVSIGYKCIGGISTKPSKSVFIGSESEAENVSVNYGVAIGYKSVLLYGSGIAIGAFAKASANNAIQLGAKTSFPGHTNSDANTFKVGNANGNFEMMDANGNLPADRLASTTGLTDGNYRLRLTMANGVPTLSWVAE